jgi:hypothetical protein
MKPRINVSVPFEDLDGNQIDLDAYYANWRSMFKEIWTSNVSISYGFDSATSPDEIEDVYELEDEGVDTESLMYAIQNAHTYAYTEGSSYKENEGEEGDE